MNRKWSRIQSKANFPIDSCSYITDNIKNPNRDDWWMNPNGDQDFFIKCEGTTSSKIAMSGSIDRVRTSIIDKLPNGLVDILNADFECTMTKIYSSGALSSTVQVISLQGPGTHSISGTIFEFCGINPFHYIKDNNALPDGWDPSLIYVRSDSNSINNFNGAKFRHPKTGSKQPYELCPTRPIRIEGDCSLNYTGRNDLDFYNSTCYSLGSFFWLGTKKDIFISNCNFQECFSKGKTAHAIWIMSKTEGNVNIRYCNFLDCGKNNEGYTILTEASGLTFFNNSVIFTDSSNSSGCVQCYAKGQYTFENNYFLNARESYDNYRGAAIDYQGTLNEYAKDENIVLDGNTFDCIHGNNEGRCFSAQIREGKFTILNRNYVQNCPAGKFFVKIMERSRIQDFQLIDWKFINNSVSDNYGGGAGIWIENEIFNNKYTYPFNLTIQGCEFRDNYCTQKGGAFQIGSNDNDENRDKFVTTIEVKIIECTFQNNTALQGGGAVAIQTNYPLEITGCTFTDNKSPLAGGAIYLKTVVNDPTGNNEQMPSAIITSCTFRGNSGEQAHCIYIVDAPKTTIDISLCNFYNNYDKNYESGSCILSNSFQLSVTTCNFINDGLEHASGGINVTSCCILDISSCNFENCTAGNIDHSYGGGIGYANVGGVDRNESIKIKRCIFEGNGGVNGVAIGLKPAKTYPEISNIDIKNHILSSWIFFIFFQFETDGDFELYNIKFIGNSFDSAKYSEFGGGTGIWIAESEDINYHNAFNLVFNTCTFTNNRSPENGGAFSYGGSPRLESIGITFNSCTFENNRCEHYFGGAIRFETRKPVSLIGCTFNNNIATRQSETGGSGGGAVFIGSEVESVFISGCTFENCFAYRGSFIFTNGAMDDINISKCTFQNLQEGQDNSVYIEVDSQITRFVFDSNIFKNLHCDGPDGGAGLHIFNGADCIVSNCQFENCKATATNKITDSGVIRISETVDTNSLLIFNLCVFNNQDGSSENTARPIYIAHNSLVQFNSCRFLNYDQDTQRDGTILYSKSESSTVFYNCSFAGLKGKCLMHMENAKDVDILDCQFTNCQVTNSLIFADKAINFTVSNNLFLKDNDPIRFGKSVKNGLISNNTFEECSTSKSGGGALFIDGNDLAIEIKDNNFTKCTAKEGLAIYIDEGVSAANIHDCKFENNYREISFAYTIYTKSSALNFNDCTIFYTENWQGCGIKIDAPCAAEIYNILFKNLRRPSAIEYYLENSQTTDKITIVSNCLFTGFNAMGSASSGVKYSSFRFGTNLNIQFYNNTIQNQISNGWSNLLIGLIDKEIENCSFINNEVIGSKAGGSGLDITGSAAKIINCNFEKNHALFQEGIGGSGGAVQFGKTASLEIDGCTFINNRADLEGGAISIQCTSTYIHDSRFERNYAAQQNFGNSTINNKMGGAIYFNNPAGSESSRYTLSNCFFYKNTGSSNGHAICVEGLNTYVYICDLCLFEDNSRNNGGSQIFINQSAHLDFSNSTVCLNNFTTKSRGIELSDGELNAHDTTFTSIEASMENNAIEGNAILVDRGNNVANIEDNLFKDCYITQRNSFSVTFNGKVLNFFRNKFDFSSNKGCGCLRIYTTGNINVENNIFQNAYLPIKGFHGIFMYEEKQRVATDKHTVIKFNTFENCTCNQTACFQFKWISDDYEFIDNTFQNNDLINYLGEFNFMGKKINGTFYMGRNKFINNTGRSYYGGGTGLWFENKEDNQNKLDNHFTIIIEECLFDGNHAVDCDYDSGRKYRNGNGGAIQFGWSESISNVDVEILNSTFINNIADSQGGALSIQIIGYTLIKNCTFNGNKAGQNPNNPMNVLGGAIYVWPDFNWATGHYTTSVGGNWLYSENITVIDSNFINNQAKDATSIYVQDTSHTDLFVINSNFINNYNSANSNFSIVTDSKRFVFDKSKIEFSDKNKASSGIRTSSLTTITNSHFLKNCILDGTKAEALLIESDTDEVEISGTTFEDCGKNGFQYTVAKINSPIINIHQSVFNFSSNNKANSCQPLLIQVYSEVTFIENKITNSNCKGAFQYDPSTGDKSNENIIIKLCTFEKLQGENSRALNVKLSTDNITFINNTIQDCQITNSNGYLFVFSIQTSDINEFVLDNVIFRNLETDSDFGGGCGCWVQHNVKYTLIFRDCIFENNHAKQTKIVRGCYNGKGGALQYGWTPSISNVDLRIESCKFNKNTADDEGGALCLMIQGNIEIYDCKFINNQAGLNKTGVFYGGAISIIPEYNYQTHQVTESIIIDDCTFTGNGAHDANAIYVNRAPQTDLIITNNCNFLDNTNKTSTQATVMAETRKLEVDDSIFDFTSLTKSCNAITTNATTVVLDNTQFYRCLIPSQEQGSALLLKEGTKTSKINNCHFIDNGNGNKGSVIYTEASSFEFSNSEIGFTKLSASDRGIFVPYMCKFYIYNSYLHHCQTAYTNANGASFYYKGERKTGHTEEISLENVHFYNNSAEYASVFYMTVTTIPKLKNLTVQDHRKGNFGIVIIFNTKVRDEILVEKCTFDNNYRGRSSERLPDCGGSGLWIACANQSSGYLDSYRLIFNQCTFKNNQNNYCGGAFAYGYSPTLRYIFVDFNDCTFENNTCDGEMGGALAFNGQVPVTLTRTVFKGNKCNSDKYKGHCIYIHQRCKAVINDCTFLDNGIYGHTGSHADTTSGHSIIQCSGNQLDMNNCIMNFTDPDTVNSRFIDIDFYSIVNLKYSTFSNCNAGDLWGGAIHLNKDVLTIVDEQITIDSCIFDNVKAANGCAALLNSTGVPTLNNLTFRNTNDGTYIFAVFFVAFRDSCTVENTVFENCSAAKEDGGGSAIWIANQEQISHGRPFELIFSNCTWRNNHAKQRGGAIHYGNSKTLRGVQMTFEKCQFDGNHAKEEGGAVSLVTRSPIVFSDCVFMNNYVEDSITKDSTTTKGGSISVNSKTPLVSISGCSFSNETSNDGNSVFIHPNVQACIISRSTFNNCGRTGTVIVSETIEFMLLDSKVSFDRRTQSARALEIRTISITKISFSTFINCHSSDVGGAIYLNNSLMSEEQEDFTLEESTFDACESDKDGCAFYLNVSSSPVLKKITFQNHRFDKNVSVVINNYEFQDLYTIESCSFINNLFQNTNKQDGGGSGIFITNGIRSAYESSYKLSFVGCTWSKNNAAYGGAFSSGNNLYHQDTELSFERCIFNDNIAANYKGGSLYLSTTQQIYFDECTFNNNRCHNPDSPSQINGGAIYIESCLLLTVIHSTFTENYATDGHAIWVEDIPIVDIIECIFTSNNNDRSGSQICTKCQQLSISDSTIEFSEKKPQARGLHILRKCMNTFNNCQFVNCNLNEYGGGIYITNDTPSLNRTESLTLTDCIFDKCDGSNGAAIHGTISCNPTIQGCTISNCNVGHYILVLIFNTIQQFVSINDCTFIGNYFQGTSTSDSGGIGLWIAHEREMSVEKFLLSFNRCYFISNKAGKNGGAFAYGESPTLKNISLTFTRCVFNGNTCDGGNGGALFLSVNQQITIDESDFNDNKCNGPNTKGSSIYVSSPSEIVIIRDSTFYGGQAIEGAIYSTSQTNNLIISGTTLNNCGSSSAGSSIYSESSKFTFQSSFIFFDIEHDIKCRGIHLVSKADVVLTDSQFYNCQSSGEGGGIKIDMTSGSNDESVSINSCTFENTEAKNGCAIFAQLNLAPTLYKVTIRNSTNGNYVLTIIFKTYVEQVSVKECVFEYNEFANNNYPPLPDGGGSGIWIANDGLRDDDKSKHLLFDHCLWYGNKVKDSSTLKYGGGFAFGTSTTTRNTELTFRYSRFIQNKASEKGGGLYLCTTAPVTITNCIFDGNEASEGSSLYSETTSSVNIEYTQIARGKGTQNGALYVNNNEVLTMKNVTFSENKGNSPNIMYLHNEGKATIENCKFDFSRLSSNHYGIYIYGEASSASIDFTTNCFTHKGNDSGSPVYISFKHKGQINIPSGNCFDLSESASISKSGSSISLGAGIFNCQSCGDVYIPTLAPDATPSGSPGPIDPSSQYATEKPPTSGTDSSNKKKKLSTKMIAMIAGIAAAVVILIVVIILLLWLFVFRKRSKGEKDSENENASEMNDEKITEIHGIDPAADDPIWAGTDQDNPLYNGSNDDQNAEQMINNDFEESWGEI